MFLLRFVFKSVLFWLLSKVLGRFLPIFRRLFRMMR